MGIPKVRRGGGEGSLMFLLTPLDTKLEVLKEVELYFFLILSEKKMFPFRNNVCPLESYT